MATAKDPICAMDVDTANPPGGTAVHAGTTYYFDVGAHNSTCTTWAAWKSVTTPSSIFRSTVTVEPHSLECALAVASGCSSRPIRAMFPAKPRIFAL